MNRTGTISFAALALFVSASVASAQHPPDPTAEPHTILLWNDGAPGTLGTADKDIPTLTVFQPYGEPKAPRTAVIVVPGGSYEWLAANHEGRQEANYLNSLAVAAFLLKYRVGPKSTIPSNSAMPSAPFVWCVPAPRNSGSIRIASA